MEHGVQEGDSRQGERTRELARRILQVVTEEHEKQQKKHNHIRIQWVFDEFPDKDPDDIRAAINLLIKAKRIGISNMKPFEKSWVFWTDTRDADPPDGPLDIEDVEL